MLAGQLSADNSLAIIPQMNACGLRD